MLRKDNIMKLIVNHQRRLETLEEKQALYGVTPHILMEIEDIKAEIEELKTELEVLEDSDVNEGSLRTFFELAKDTNLKRRVQIYLADDFSSLSADRQSAAIDAFAAIVGISPQAIEVYQGPTRAKVRLVKHSTK